MLLSRSNIRPDYADSNFHEFKMHTFTRVTSCRVCQMLLRSVGVVLVFSLKELV